MVFALDQRRIGDGWKATMSISPEVRSWLDDLHSRIAEEIVREVAELPDRTSPEDQPEMMLVTADELKAIVIANLGKNDK